MQRSSEHDPIRFLILGGGLAGLSTAYHLTQLGATGVTLIEGNAEFGRAASAQNAGILRTVLSEAHLRPLAQASRRFLVDPPPGFSKLPLVDPVGLVLTADQPAAAAELAACVAAHDQPIEALSPAALARRAPHVRTRALCAYFAPHEGHVFPERVIEGFARAAGSAGVRLWRGQRVAALLESAGAVHGVRLADGRELHAEQVVLALGAWGARLAGSAGSPLPLTPRRRHVLVGPADARVNPRWPVVWNGGDTFYSKPAEGGLWLCACDQDPVDPGPDGGAPVALSPAELAHIRERAARHLDPRLLEDWWLNGGNRDQRAWAGLRTFGLGERFRIGPDPSLRGLFWVGALGGHGLVTAPAVGELAARALLGRCAPTELEGVDPRAELAARA
jgi:glycine/D-amino acid oxidase-like deaminating enzyme